MAQIFQQITINEGLALHYIGHKPECTHNFKNEERHVFVCPISVYYNRLKTL